MGTKQKRKILLGGEKRHWSLGGHTCAHYTQYWIGEICLNVTILVPSQPIYPSISLWLFEICLVFKLQKFSVPLGKMLVAEGLLIKTGLVNILDGEFVVSVTIRNWITHCGGVRVCAGARCVGIGGERREGESSIWPECGGFPTTWKRNETPCNSMLL